MQNITFKQRLNTVKNHIYFCKLCGTLGGKGWTDIGDYEASTQSHLVAKQENHG
jgi:hypothetical protein